MQQQQTNCIHCKPYFELGQTLPPQGIHIQYKKYYLPIKDHQPKWILLKTIIAFLNSKGGTIFMGVDDSTREVVGLTAQLKEQDLFMLDFAQLLEQIKPEVDLRRKEEVKVRFVPVLKDKTFQGKYVIKIIVKQGNPSKVYHFAQTLKFICQDKRSHDEDFKVLWGFYRSNMGKVDSIKGTQLLREVYEKATNPSIVVETFHPGCNPEPLQVSVRNMNIGFKSLKDVKLRELILSCIDRKFKSINLTTTYSVEDCKEDDTFILKFKSITDYKEADACILEHQKQIKSMIGGRDSLIDEGYLDNTHFYKIGQEFNPSLRYLRNRQKSRNKSIDVEKKIYKKFQKEVKSPLPPKPNQMTNKTNFKSKQEQSKSPAPTDAEEFLKPQNKFVKNLPQEEGEPLSDEEVPEQEVEESPEKIQSSPVKPFKAKPEEFPEIGTNNLPPKPNKNTMKNTETVNNEMPPKPRYNKQSPVKQITSKKQSANEKVEYSLLFSDIYEKSYPKLVHYLENSLGNRLDRIPHKIQQNENNQQVAIHFHSLKDIENFIQGLSTHLHTRKVFHGFGQGKAVTIKVRKGQQIQDFDWASQNQINNQQSKEKNKNTSLSKQSHPRFKQQSADKKKNQSRQRNSNSKSKPQYIPKKPQSQSFPHAELQISPGKKMKSPNKQKFFTQIKGFPFIITNLKSDLSQDQKMQLTSLLRENLKKACSQNALVQILNEKTFSNIVGLNFQREQERKHFSDQIQTSMIKNHEFTDLFKGKKVFWGVPSGNVIMHHYKSDEKNRAEFKEGVDRLFENKEWECYESRFTKQDNKYFLRLTFHPNQFVAAFERAFQGASQSPIKQYSSWKEGIVVYAEMSRI